MFLYYLIILKRLSTISVFTLPHKYQKNRDIFFLFNCKLTTMRFKLCDSQKRTFFHCCKCCKRLPGQDLVKLFEICRPFAPKVLQNLLLKHHHIVFPNLHKQSLCRLHFEPILPLFRHIAPMIQSDGDQRREWSTRRRTRQRTGHETCYIFHCLHSEDVL